MAKETTGGDIIWPEMSYL